MKVAGAFIIPPAYRGRGDDFINEFELDGPFEYVDKETPFYSGVSTGYEYPVERLPETFIPGVIVTPNKQVIDSDTGGEGGYLPEFPDDLAPGKWSMETEELEYQKYEKRSNLWASRSATVLSKFPGHTVMVYRVKL